MTPGFIESVEKEILLPTLQAMEADGCPFQGLLYAGLMLTPEGPKVQTELFDWSGKDGR